VVISRHCLCLALACLPALAAETDSLNTKLRLLESAYQRGDYRLARALADSLRHTIVFDQQQREDPGKPALASARRARVDQLPEPWRQWARGWRYHTGLTLEETQGLPRDGEPVEFLASFPASETESLRREVRVARIQDGRLHEVPCQVTSEITRGAERLCRLTLLADSSARARSTYLLFYGNPDAELTDYPTDLTVSGEGFALDIENDHFRASLSRQMGQLERITMKRDHGLQLFAGGEAHGEPPGIDWAHDYVTANNLQKLRVTNWPAPPDYEVIRGPLSLTVRRWGFPNSTVDPVYSPARIHIFVEYRFFAGLPYFFKETSMEAVQDVDITYLRDDEWVFSGYSFTDPVWMSADGKLRTGPVDKESQEDLWAVGFFNRTSRDAFIGLFLKHEAQGLPPLKHTGAPMMHYFPHGHVWSRALYQKASFKAGGVLRQKTAYFFGRYPEQGGAEMVEQLRRSLAAPLAVAGADLPGDLRAAASPGALARPGEAGDSPIDKRVIWDALRDCRDDQLYAARPSVVDLGLIYDVRVRGDTVYVLMTMPHRGRPRYGYFAWGSGGNTQPIRQRLLKLPGVRKVVIENTWEPAWDTNRITEAGRRALGFPP
jgi:metal-sulfur cluster biosynthetic enzyme